MNMTVTISAPIGSGKSSLTKILSDFFGTKAFYEPVDPKENPVLPLFYKDKDKYAFLLQVYFLNKRFEYIKEAYKTNNAIIDSSIYTDQLFLERLYKDGNCTEIELNAYQELFNNMMEEIEGLPKKTPDLMLSIDISLEEELRRIRHRGRDFEQDDSLVEYYTNLLSDYKAWFSKYDLSEKLTIDADKYDFVNNIEDTREVLQMIMDALVKIGTIDENEYIRLHEKLTTYQVKDLWN